jgi:hypothetical protein
MKYLMDREMEYNYVFLPLGLRPYPSFCLLFHGIRCARQ